MARAAKECKDKAKLTPDVIRTRFDDTFTIEPRCGRRYLVHNRTPNRIRIARDGYGEIVVPPLAQRVVRGARIAPFADDIRELRQRHQLRVRSYVAPTCSSSLAAAVWVAAIALVVVVVHDLLHFGTLVRPEAIAVATILAGLLVTVLFRAARRERARRNDAEVGDTEDGDIEFGMGGAFFDGNDTLRRTKQFFTLLVVIGVGAVLPAIAIFAATDAREFLVMEGGLDIVDGTESRLVGRVIQVLYTATLSLFPALLYFQFDRHRIGTIRSEWVRAIFRLDRRMTTLADVNARYGDELSEASSYSTDTVRLLGGRHSPIIVATLLITLGWTLLVVRTDSFDFAGSSEVASLAQVADDAAARANAALASVEEGDAEPEVGAAVAAAARDEAAAAGQEAEILAGAAGTDDGAPATTATAQPPTADPRPQSLAQDAAAAAAAAESAAAAEDRLDQPYFQFLVPTPSAATMAFLGAYFFAMYLLLRSYFRGDLRPKIYNQITARLITVVVLAYLINTLFYEVGGSNVAVWMLAFLAGVIPTAVLRGLSHLVTGLGRGLPFIRAGYAEAFSTPRALTQIDGVDIYESARLETEGITDIPSLVHVDLVSVMIKTRLPVERLVDWTDQAVLIMVLNESSPSAETGDEQDQGQERPGDDRMAGLRRVGIRTASALLDASDQHQKDQDLEPLRAIAEAAVATGGTKGAATELDALATVIRRERAMNRILEWRQAEDPSSCVAWPEIIVENGHLVNEFEPSGPHLGLAG